MEHPILQAQARRLAVRQQVKADWAKRHAGPDDGKKTGDSTEWTGLFIPLPRGISSQFPVKKSGNDKSPPHVTLLYVGNVKGHEDEFIETCQRVVSEELRGPVQAKLEGLDYFTHESQQRRVAILPIRFSHRMAELRDRLKSAIQDIGVEVTDSWTVYRPHTTLEYLDGLDTEWEGPIPTGSWSFDEIEVWGMPQVHKLRAGMEKYSSSDPFLEMGSEAQQDFRGLIEDLTFWMGNANVYHLKQIAKRLSRNKALRSWFQKHVEENQGVTPGTERFDQVLSRAWRQKQDKMGVLDSYSSYHHPVLTEEQVAEYAQGDSAVAQAIEALHVPTEYAKTNEREDFAESFVAFMSAPEKLSDVGKFRMQRALSMSGLYGKPLMRLARGQGTVGKGQVPAKRMGMTSESWQRTAGAVFRVAQAYTKKRAARPIPINKVEAKGLTDKIMQVLPQHLRFRDDPSDSLYSQRGFRPDTWGFVVAKYVVQDVKGALVAVDVKVESRNKALGFSGPRQYVVGGAVTQRVQGSHAFKYQMTVTLDAAKSPKAFLDNEARVAKEVYSVLIHEITHLRDLLAPGGISHLDEDTYHNEATEIRAFMQQIVDEVIDYVHEQGGAGNLWAGASMSLLDRALENSTTWNRVHRALNTQAKKTLLKGVYTGLQDEMPHLQELYPPEDNEWMKEAALRIAKTFTLNVGDPVLYGKYKNKKGVIKEFKTDEKSGEPVVIVEPVPKGRKQDMEIKLFKLRYDEAAATAGGLSKEAVLRVSAKYQKKKEVPKADGKGTTTVYEYSEGQIELRNREKAKQVEKLRGSITKLRAQVSKDLKSKDEDTRLKALIVGLMDETYERVGNEESAEDGHYGVTGWKVKHLTFSGNKVTVKYVGKSGVSHEKVVSDPALVSALKAAKEGKGENDSLTGDISAEDVNEYLEPFGITAKDMRGYHANAEMQSRLKDIRSKGGELPEDKKERGKLLKKEFEQALKETAKAVGHEPSTLKSQYLVPGLADKYLASGEVMKRLDKKGSDEDPVRLGKGASTSLRLAAEWIRKAAGRVASAYLYRQATKDEGEKENEEVERMNRPKPSKKPPRQDLRRNRMDEYDPDVDDTGKAEKDPDLSLNYKKVAAITDAGDRMLMVLSGPPIRIAGKVPQDAEHKEGDYWQTENGWGVWPPKSKQPTSAPDEESAKRRAEGGGEGEEEEDPEVAAQQAEERKVKEREQQRAKQQRQLADFDKAVQGMDLGDLWPEEPEYPEVPEDQESAQGVRDHIQRLKAEYEKNVASAKQELAEAYASHMGQLLSARAEDGGLTVDVLKRAQSALKRGTKGLAEAAPQVRAKRLAEYVFATKVVANPRLVGGRAVNNNNKTAEELHGRSLEAYHQFRKAGPGLLDAAADQLKQELDKADPESDEYIELDAIKSGMMLAAAVQGRQLSGTEEMSKSFQRMAQSLAVLGDEDVLLKGASDLYSPEGRVKVRDALDIMSDDELVETVAGDNSPYEAIGRVLTDDDEDNHITAEGRAFARDVLKMLALNDMTVTQGFLNAFHKGKETDEKGKGKTKPTSKPTTDPESLAERVRQAKTDDKALKGAADELAHCIAKAVTQEDLESCLKAGEGVQVQDLRLTMSTAEKLSGTVPDKMNPNVARVRHVSETGDLSVLDQKVEPKDDGRKVREDKQNPEKTPEQKKQEWLKNVTDPKERKRIREMRPDAFRAYMRAVTEDKELPS